MHRSNFIHIKTYEIVTNAGIVDAGKDQGLVAITHL